MTGPPPELLRRKTLQLEDLTVSFDGFKALDGLSLTVDPGELRCIIGPNGAGKTTMFENLELALWGDKSFWKALIARLTSSERQHIDDVLDLIGLTGHRAVLAGTLSHGQKQWLEIGMLLMQEPELLLVDEPVAGMTPQETERTAELLLSLRAEHTLIVVEHDMDFVRSIARRVTVLHEGRVLAEGDMDQVQNDPRVIDVYLGA